MAMGEYSKPITVYIKPLNKLLLVYDDFEIEYEQKPILVGNIYKLNGLTTLYPYDGSEPIQCRFLDIIFYY